jgi:hypothetical protein
LSAGNIACDGCLAATGRQCVHCGECGIRLCGLSHGVANCGVCDEYDLCIRIKCFLIQVPAAKPVLDDIHATHVRPRYIRTGYEVI